MSDEDLDFDEEVIDDPEIDALASEEPAQSIDCRRRLEQKLEDVRLRKMLDDYDYDFD